MDRRRAILILIAALALVDLVGVVLLRNAWSARDDKATMGVSPARRAQPASDVPGGETSAVHAGT